MLAACLDMLFKIAGWLAILDVLEGWQCWLAVQPGRLLGYAG